MENLWTMHIQFFKVLFSFRSCISFLVGWCTSKINRLFSIIITCSVFRSIFSTQTETTIWMILLLLKPLWFVFFHYHATEFVCLQMFCDDFSTKNSCDNWMVPLNALNMQPQSVLQPTIDTTIWMIVWQHPSYIVPQALMMWLFSPYNARVYWMF